ncbi:MAG TPA: type II toxin-antitoxin system RelE/ParE family toxin [Candidatus Limnocylindrales bacterium]|nr:type II toxin-antitoxin system RelE/ParE family toxin [Candidatus Limnocylindrales bacterium]
MKARFVLAPQAAIDLAEIWRYIKSQSSVGMADHVESVIRDKFVFLAQSPEAGHYRRNLTNEEVKFFPVYSYLIVYRSATKPLQIVAIVHGRRDVEQVLRGRL